MHPLVAALDWEREERDAVDLLRGLLRFDTSNPPGDERPCAEYLAEYLASAGLDPVLLEAEPGRANLLARLAGGDDAPLLLSGHLDVVPAEPGAWTRPPFAAEEHDGMLWGRGAVDMKSMVAMSASVLRMLARTGAPLRRTVLLAAVADEETGCDLGSRWLVDHHADRVRAGYALGEVGGATYRIAGRPVYPVQVAERGVCWVRATARGTSGHGSIPRQDNPVVRLAGFLARLGPRALPLHLSAPVERYVRALADLHRQPARAVLRALLRPSLSAAASRLLPHSTLAGVLQAVLRNTASPTVVRAGAKTNVIPSEASAELDGRVALDSSAEELLAELRALAGAGIDLEVVKAREPTATSPDTPLYRTIASVVGQHHPGAVVIPAVIPGFTDAHAWSRLGTRCYGFAPLRLSEGDPAFHELFHADDERVPLAGFRSGLRMLADTVFRFACTQS